MTIVPVIMAGGAGTRLWPMSRDEKPKQFLNLSGEGTLFEETISRLRPLNPAEIVVVTSVKYRDITSRELEKFSYPAAVLAEPRPRNTAAAILYGAVYCEKAYGDSLMLVLPADHYIARKDSFIAAVQRAVDVASDGSLVTIGITPAYPETGYGYIQSKQNEGPVRDVSRFVEKPDFETAAAYCASGDYFWNSGIFIWKTSAIIAAFKKYLPEMVAAFAPLFAMEKRELVADEGNVPEVKEKIFNLVESLSIDVGILEKCDTIKVVPGDFGWKDLGSWTSVDDILTPDEVLNRTPVSESVFFHGSKNCSAYAESANIAVIGCENIVVVQAGNNVLVMNKDQAQEVKLAAGRFGR